MRQMIAKADLVKTDAEIVQLLLPGACVEPLEIDFDRAEKNVREVRVTVNDAFHGQVQIDGVRATRSFPFRGDRMLFTLRPNQWSSAIPYAEVGQASITIGIEGRNNAETIKQELDRQQKILGEYTEWSTTLINQHNARLEGLLAAAVARRREHLASLEDLKSRI
ncbi:hypothetical protein [Mesorhizobium sp. ANAO-SY3R2]|uniref:hypothetical protein n=1 Tax=Mesorhizobium sp. ANAO-SY3R2 TaxID=3166644 RepID=UPI00366FD3D7